MYHSLLTLFSKGYPLTVVYVMSGNIVGEWLPQTANFSISLTVELVFTAICQSDLSWSSLVKAQKFYLGKSFACKAATKQFVLAGLAIITTFTSRFACSLIDFPWAIKMGALSYKRSRLYIPTFWGFPPTKKIACVSLKPELEIWFYLYWCPVSYTHLDVYKRQVYRLNNWYAYKQTKAYKKQ